MRNSPAHEFLSIWYTTLTPHEFCTCEFVNSTKFYRLSLQALLLNQKEKNNSIKFLDYWLNQEVLHTLPVKIVCRRQAWSLLRLSFKELATSQENLKLNSWQLWSNLWVYTELAQCYSRIVFITQIGRPCSVPERHKSQKAKKECCV